MKQKVLAIDNYESMCFKCLQKKNKINKFSLYRSDYGSSFDNYYTYMQICDDCKPDDIEIWFREEPEMIDGYCANYKHEKDIISLVNSFPLEGKELFWNRCAYGACAHTMDSQDWIDDELGILPDEKYEEYGMYSPSQINSYHERFPTCEHPVNVTYSDKSKASYCPFGASGNYNQEASANISDECHDCLFYKVRETPVKEMDRSTYKKYEEYINGKLAVEKYSNLFE